MDDFESSPLSRPIDLYLSFRGDDDDTCRFIGSLLAALRSALEIDDLNIFWDDKKLDTGNSAIPPHLLQAIQQSCISIVVFSKTYASSVWCLQELSEIVACVNGQQQRHTVIPVFFDVDPSEVRKQSNTYEKAFAELEERFAADLDQIRQWRQAMRQAADVCGSDIQYYPGSSSSYSEDIEKIVTAVKEKMGRVIQSYEVDHIYRLKWLTKEQALQLFCRAAFRRDYPVRGGYEELTYRVLEYTDCHPLAVVILGSFLRQKSVTEWRRALKRLERIPSHQIMEVLKIGFDDLDAVNKEIFLDIACFFVGKKINCVKEILHNCGFSADIGIELLIKKSFMTILDEKIQMPYMLQEMGQEIVQQECPSNPGEWSRLWLFNDICHVMQENIATEKVEAMVLNSEGSKETTLNIEALAQMTNLRFLILQNVNFVGDLNSLSNKLRYVSWHQFPCRCLPSNFESHMLVELVMPDSNVIELWEGQKMFPNLRNINLSGSKTLIKTPDFGGVLNLERLDLEKCIGLLQLHPSIAQLSKLNFLNLKNCINLVSFFFLVKINLVSFPRDTFDLLSLDNLNLTGCSKLKIENNLKSGKEVKVLNRCLFFL